MRKRLKTTMRTQNLVPSKGLEPPHRCRYMDLNHARLPIPPRWQVDFNRRDGPWPPDQEDLHVYSTARLLAVKPSHSREVNRHLYAMSSVRGVICAGVICTRCHLYAMSS